MRFDLAKPGGDAGHPSSAEPVKDHISWIGVVEDVSHDGLVRNLGVVRVGVVNWTVLTLAHVCREWLAAVGLTRIVGRTVVLNEIRNERIGQAV